MGPVFSRIGLTRLGGATSLIELKVSLCLAPLRRGIFFAVLTPEPCAQYVPDQEGGDQEDDQDRDADIVHERLSRSSRQGFNSPLAASTGGASLFGLAILQVELTPADRGRQSSPVLGLDIFLSSQPCPAPRGIFLPDLLAQMLA